MTVTYTIGSSGELSDPEGHVLGRLVALVIEPVSDRTESQETFKEGPLAVKDNGNVNSKDQRQKPSKPSKSFAAAQTALDVGETPTSTPGSEEKGAIAPEVLDVWEHYLATIGRGWKLTTRRRQLIEGALKLRGPSVVKDAITGLSRSPFHNGENEQAKKYLGIRYALLGNQRTGETAEERIDSMAELASTQPTNVSQLRERPGPTQGRVDALKRMIVNSWRPPDRPQVEDLTMRDHAIAELEQLGIRTSFREDDGWPEFAELDEGLEEIG